MSKTNEFFALGTKALVANGSKGAIAELHRRAKRGSARAEKALEGLEGKAKALWGCVALEANTPVAPAPEPEPEAPSVVVMGHIVSQSLAEALIRNVGHEDFAVFLADDEEWQAFVAAVDAQRRDNDEADMPRDLAGLKVSELRDLAKEHGIVVPKGTKKGGLIALLDSSLDALDCEGDDGVPF